MCIRATLNKCDSNIETCTLHFFKQTSNSYLLELLHTRASNDSKKEQTVYFNSYWGDRQSIIPQNVIPVDTKNINKMLEKQRSLAL